MALDAGSEKATSDTAGVVLQRLEDGPLSGYEISRSGKGRVAGRSVGWLYPTLYELEAQGAIAARWQLSSGRTRRRYSISGGARNRFAVWRGPSGEVDQPAGANAARPMPESVAVAAFLDRMAAALTLPAAQRTAIRREVADHLEDAGLDWSTFDPATAAQPDRLLGSPERLAAGMLRGIAQRRSLWQAARTGVLLAPGLLLFSAAAAALVLTCLRVAVEAALRIGLAGDASFATPALYQRQQVLPIVVGAFIAGRFLTGQVFAVGSPRGPRTAALLTALGAAILGVPALGHEMDLDLLTAVVLAAVPGAFVLGAATPVRFGQALITARGVAAAAILGVALLAAPLDGILVYSSPAAFGTPGGVWVSGDSPANFDETGWRGWVNLEESDRFTKVCAEARPALLRGWLVEVDLAHSGWQVCSADNDDLTYGVPWLSPPPERKGGSWLLLVSLTDRSGQTQVVWSDVVTPRYHGSVVGWLTGRPSRPNS